MTTLKQARPLIEARQSFSASSVFALAYPKGYVVFSYGHHHPMFACVNRADGKAVWFVNATKVSATTSKHTTTLAPRGVYLRRMSRESMLHLHRAIAREDARELECFSYDYDEIRTA